MHFYKKYFLFIGLALTMGIYMNSASACETVRSFGTDILAAQGNCAGIIGGQVGTCGPMNAGGTYWYCECRVNCEQVEGLNLLPSEKNLLAAADKNPK